MLRKNNEDYVQHLKEFHECDIKIEHGNFNNQDEFEEFKRNLEQETKTLFNVRNSRPGYKLYKCQYDKVYHSKETSKQLIDQERDPKLNQIKCFGSCPSSIISKTDMDGSVCVRIINYHPHDIICKFLSISTAIRNDILTKLSLGIGEQTCLKQIRQENPDFLITLQDIQNVKRLKNIDVISQHENDKLSCSLIANSNPNIVKILSDDVTDASRLESGSCLELAREGHLKRIWKRVSLPGGEGGRCGGWGGGRLALLLVLGVSL